ncbi:MAG: SdpI family protein [Deltaproteobacteria bacterium]|nr:SdpI family protein [Deltaproteobacteria bacterium]
MTHPAWLRVAAPLSTIAISASISVWARTGPLAFMSGWRVWLPLAAAPSVGLALFVGVRVVAGGLGRRGDLILTGFLSLLALAHALLLLDQLGKLEDVPRMPLVAGLSGAVFVLLGPALMGLEPGNAMGVRTEATLGDPVIWKESHRLLGQGFAISGALAIALAAFSPIAGLALLFVGPGIAIAASAIHARGRAHERVEDRPPQQRPTSGTKSNDSERTGV